MKKTLTLIAKGILFYTTFFFALFYISAIDSLAEQSFGYILFPFIAIFLLAVLFLSVSDKEDLEKITGYTLFKGKIH